MKKFTLNPQKVAFSCLFFLGLFTATAQTFEYKNSGTDFILFDMSIPPGQNNVAFAAGAMNTQNSDGVIIKTEDAGETWETIFPTSGTVPGFEKIEFLNDDKGFAVGYGAFKTEDAGETWEEITIANDLNRYSSLEFFNENVGIATAFVSTGVGFEVYVTNDGGDTWNTTSSIDDIGSISLGYADENTLFSVGNNQIISKSTNGGDTWEVIRTGTPQFFNVEVSFKDLNNGVVSGEDGQLLTTHDSGETWDEFATGYHNFYGLTYIGDQILASGTDEDVYISQDNGSNWNLAFDGDGTSTMYEIQLFEDGSGLICGSQGKMIKFEDVILSNNIPENLSGITHFYSSASKELTIASKNETIEDVAIYSLTGQLVRNVSNTSNTAVINTSSLSNGTYIATISVAGKTKTIKFVRQ
ncbi:YCF48-related protein [Marixanthomonas ophiurae]|uniref:T9SS C-terminal target domain-containing protein n=1 Tax=Marixanthomonas ophiurae TaxID=387659 RepID=A0A3E1Q6Y3_9FLAO|nr:YCF48-related protein [Marixanthomonas ophiurae]RFN57897.1 T9SS C-terminal target domain-containing protein [Marixanthomonas ophiurae]